MTVAQTPAAIRAELKMLKLFARDVLTGYQTGVVGDVSGDWLEARALELGLLVESGGDCNSGFHLSPALLAVEPPPAPTDNASKPEGEAMSTSPERSNPVEENSQYVLLPAGSIVHQNGVPVRLITGALVTVAYDSMSELFGHHLGSVPVAPSPSPGPAPQGDSK